MNYMHIEYNYHIDNGFRETGKKKFLFPGCTKLMVKVTNNEDILNFLISYKVPLRVKLSIDVDLERSVEIRQLVLNLAPFSVV